MTSLDFAMTPVHAAACRQVGLLSAAHACRLAMAWLEAGSESNAVAAVAIEDPSYVAWADISVTFNDALSDSGVPSLSPDEVRVVLMHCLLRAAQNRELALAEFWSVGTHTLGSGGSKDFALPRVSTERLFGLSLEYDEAMMGALTGRTLPEIAEDLRQEVERVLSEIEQAWPVCLNGLLRLSQ